MTETLSRNRAKEVAMDYTKMDVDFARLRSQNNQATHYKGVTLQDGDKIYSTASFPVQNRGTPQAPNDVGAKGVLVQDHTGKVSDMTVATERAKLTGQEKAQMALKQAKMLLTNLKGTGEQTVYITGADADQAKRVCAALLLLKGDLQINIESHVPGCEVRKAAWNQRQKTVERDFIKLYLPETDIPKSMLKGLQQETHEFISGTLSRRKEMEALRQSRKDHRSKQVEVDDEVTNSGVPIKR